MNQNYIIDYSTLIEGKPDVHYGGVCSLLTRMQMAIVHLVATGSPCLSTVASDYIHTVHKVPPTTVSP